MHDTLKGTPLIATAIFSGEQYFRRRSSAYLMKCFTSPTHLFYGIPAHQIWRADKKNGKLPYLKEAWKCTKMVAMASSIHWWGFRSLENKRISFYNIIMASRLKYLWKWSCLPFRHKWRHNFNIYRLVLYKTTSCMPYAFTMTAPW